MVQIVTRQYLIKRHLGAESSEVLRLSYSLWVPSSGIPRAWRVQREVRACSSNIWSNNPLNDQNKSFVVYCNNRLASAIPPSSMVPHCCCYSYHVSSKGMDINFYKQKRWVQVEISLDKPWKALNSSLINSSLMTFLPCILLLTPAIKVIYYWDYRKKSSYSTKYCNFNGRLPLFLGSNALRSIWL